MSIVNDFTLAALREAKDVKKVASKLSRDTANYYAWMYMFATAFVVAFTMLIGILFKIPLPNSIVLPVTATGLIIATVVYVYARIIHRYIYIKTARKFSK